jgi:hypothetical protein
MIQRTLWALAALAVSAAPAVGGVTVSVNPSPARERKADYIVDTGARVFRVAYTHREEKDGGFLPAEPEPEGYAGLHWFSDDAPGNWYWKGGGFLKVTVDGENILNTVKPEWCVVSRGRKGIIEFTWRTARANVTARFCLRDGDDRLFLEIGAECQPPAKDIIVSLRNTAPFTTEAKTRRVLTPLREIGPEFAGKTEPLKQEESWLFYHSPSDEKHGPSALLWDPAQVKSAEISLPGAMTHTRLHLAEGVSKARFALWAFPPRESRTELMERFKSGLAVKGASDLRGEDFAPPPKVEIKVKD